MLVAAGETGLPRDAFALGCAISPFKTLESEQIWQYARLARKVEAGAGFIVAQAGFDPRRWDELARFCRLQARARPLLGKVLVPDASNLRRIQEDSIPGVIMPKPSPRRLRTNRVCRTPAGPRGCDAPPGRLRCCVALVTAARSSAGAA